jgi:hypothetical protein
MPEDPRGDEKVGKLQTQFGVGLIASGIFGPRGRVLQAEPLKAAALKLNCEPAILVLKWCEDRGLPALVAEQHMISWLTQEELPLEGVDACESTKAEHWRALREGNNPGVCTEDDKDGRLPVVHRSFARQYYAGPRPYNCVLACFSPVVEEVAMVTLGGRRDSRRMTEPLNPAKLRQILPPLSIGGRRASMPHASLDSLMPVPPHMPMMSARPYYRRRTMPDVIFSDKPPSEGHGSLPEARADTDPELPRVDDEPEVRKSASIVSRGARTLSKRSTGASSRTSLAASSARRGSNSRRPTLENVAAKVQSLRSQKFYDFWTPRGTDDDATVMGA